MAKTNKIDTVLSTLNNLMEKYEDEFTSIFGCDYGEIVDLYGFGYYKDDKNIVKYVEADTICDSKYSPDEIEKMISNSSGNKDDEIKMILKIRS